MKFEKVKRFENDETIHIPTRKTKFSAGYDFEVAEDTIIPSYFTSMKQWAENVSMFDLSFGNITLDKVKASQAPFKPTLVPTGIKCKLPDNLYLKLVVRSSLPLNHGLMLANSEGIIDADYYENPANDGEIFFQLYNFSPYNILLKKGDRIGQGIISSYYTTENEEEIATTRAGGFGST